MRELKNEKGYALLTVLLVMIIFMSLGMTLFAHSYNSTKQNKIVEENNQSVALAEMGITYYQTAIKNAYVANKQAIGIKVQDELLNDNTNKVTRPEGYYGDRAITLMIDAINGQLNTVDKTKTMEQPGASYLIDNFTVVKVPEGISIEYRSSGIEGTQKAMLGAELKIPIKGLQSASNPGGGTGGSGTFYELPDFNMIPYPAVTSSCKNPASLKNINCSSILIEKLKEFDENNNNLSDKTIYSNDSLSLLGSGNSMNNVRIHTDGGFYIEKNMNNMSNMLFEIKKTGTFDHLRVKDSKIYVGENLNIFKQFELENSYAYIGGNVSMDKNYHLNIDSNSKMCVAGNLSANTINISGKLYIKGTIKGIGKGKLKVTGTPTYVNTQEFTAACGNPTESKQPELTMEWGNIVNNIKYNY